MTMILSTYYRVDDRNIDHVRNNMAGPDQAAELVPGCETWGILYQGNRGQMTRWPNGRGAVCYNGDSLWGDWHGDTLILDVDGSAVDEDGNRQD